MTSQLKVLVAEPSTNGAAPGRIERKKRDKLQRIKRAARTLFGHKGFEATTTREIARAADIGAGTLFLYAGTKEDLLVMIFREEIGAAVDQAFHTMTERRLIDQLLRVFGAMIAHHERNPGLARVFVKELPFVDNRRHGVATFMAALLKRIADLIERAQERNELDSSLLPALLAQNLFALYFATLQRWLGREGTSAESRDRRLRASLELQLQGLTIARSRRGARD
ncbi:MAG TPA: helix-turn-helix domain-containing protein [Candidatus Binataceae bacterium]|nr:helix-turn-helix domain-containing protein [Candidatus Binataceae bacterium]